MYSIKSNKTKRFKGIRFKLALVYSTLFGLFLCIFAFIVSRQYLLTARNDFSKALLNYSIDLSNEIQIDSSGIKPVLHIPERELKKQFPFALGQTYYFVRSIDGDILIRGDNEFPLGEIPYKKDFALKEDYTHRFQTLIFGKNEFQAVNLKITSYQGKPLILQVATPSNLLRDQERRHILINVITIPLLILLSSLLSYFLAGKALEPIQAVTDAANNIAAKNLSLRVPVHDTGDEVSELSKTLNTLLDRLEKSFKAQENFVSNASHQLNTPLAIIKGELDVLESKARTLDDTSRFQKSLREELERLIELVKNMLLVSRVESGQENFIFVPTRVDEILLSTSSRLRTKARDKKILIRFNITEDLPSEAVTINGEKQLLTCLFENLLDNAIKYSPDESTICLDIKSGTNPLEVWIQDEGPGISPEEYENIVTHRFQRGATNLVPGTGIGLSLAYQIAAYHHASISYQKLQPQGSLFIVGFTK